MRALVLVVALFASPTALAQDADDILACVERTGGMLVKCHGSIADQCQRESGSETILGMTNCLTKEYQVWDAALNNLWPKLMARARSIDEVNESSGPDSASETLRDAQRAWITFRDAECRYHYAAFGQGSHRSVAHASCLLNLTAERVIDFFHWLKAQG